MRKQKTKKSWCPCVFLSSWAFFVLTLACLILPQTSQAAAPVADDQALITNEDTSINITLTASDAEEDSLTYSIVTTPSQGRFTTNTPPNLTYRPYSNYNGADSFTFKANDGTSDSNIATISLSINPVNDAPDVSLIPTPITFAINPEETSAPKTYIIPVSDIEGDTLTYSVVGLPLPASLNTQTGEITWTITHQDIGSYPNVTFTASDGQLQSSKIVTIVIREAATYYLDAVNGNDTNPGTSQQPWKTLARAQPNWTGAGTKVTSGDTVYLKTGQYGKFYLYKYNTAGTDWITYQNAPGHEPEIDTIHIYNSTKTNRYIKFSGIYISEYLRELPSPTEPWNHTPTILVNVRRQNYVIMEKLKLQPKNKYLNGQVFLFSECNDVTIQDCNIVDFRQGFYLDICPGIVVRHNRIYNCWNGSIISLYAGSDNALIELNHIYGGSYDKANEYFPCSKVYLDPTAFPQTPDPGFVLNEEIWQPADGSISKSVLINYRWETNKWVLYVRNSISGYIGVRASYPQTSAVNFTPTSTTEDTHRGSSLAIHSKYAIIRKNIVHDFFGQGLYFYQGVGGGQYGHVVENNCFYDIGNGNNFFQISGTFVCRNNTFIGYMANTGLNAKNIVQKYNGPISIAYGGLPWLGSFDGTGVEYYNNIFIGGGPFPDPNNEAWNKYEEDYNIVWARYYNGNYEPTSAKGANSKVLVWKDPNTTSNYGLRGYPNSLEDIGFRGSTPEYDYSRDGIQPFFVNPGFKFLKVDAGLNADAGFIWDYHLAAGSPGINFGAAQVATWQEVLSGQVTGPSQPPDSLGSVGPDGFIRDDGPARDATHHSVGCYEYISTSFLYGDVNADGEISAFDAALAAHIAVDLEHAEIKNRAAAEVSGDGEVTAYDAALIAQKAVGLIEKFPVE